MNIAQSLISSASVKSACQCLGIPRASFYRNQTPHSRVNKPCPPPLKLTAEERQVILGILHSDRFMDKAPHEIYATLLDEGQYYCSVRTMYRILNSENEVKERRKNHRQRHYQKPELLAVKANQVWSWDITKLKGPQTWTYFHLYVIIDIFSRYVVGWMIAYRELARLAEILIAETTAKQDIQPGTLTLHADRGASMKSKPVAFLLSDLGVTKTHSRPHVSDDNPYSEAHFKTLKYRPEFPERFGCIEDARAFCQTFFLWYNTEHRHSGISLLTPQTVHYGQAPQVLEKRQTTLSAAFVNHPERFKNKMPHPQKLPQEVWINKPSSIKEVDVML